MAQQPKAAMKPGKGQDGRTTPVQTGGARHPGRPGTQTAAQRAATSGSLPAAPDGPVFPADSVPFQPGPQYAAPAPGPRPTVTAPLPETTVPRTHAERNA